MKTDAHTNVRLNNLPGLVLLVFLGIVPAAWPAGQDSLSDAPAFSLAPKALLQIAAGVPKEKNADVIVLLDEEHVSIDESGRARRTTRLIYRVDTGKGVEGWAFSSAYYWPWYQSRPVIRARVVTPDGIQHDLDPQTLSDNATGENDSQNVYSDQHVFEGPLPAVSIGAIVEEAIVSEDTEPFFPGGWSTNYVIGRNQPVLKTRLTIETPSSTQLRYQTQLAPDLQIRKSERNGRTIYSFEHGRTEVLEVQPMLPPDVPRYPGISLTTATSWHAVALQYWKHTEPQIRPAEVKSMVAGMNPKDQAAIAMMIAKLHSNVRYTGLEFGEANLTPRAPSETLKRKYGDCKDKAAVLVSMLRAAGIPANLALLNAGSGRDIQPDIPGMNRFNHAIVYIPGRDLFIDTTAEYLRFGELPDEDQNRWALIIAENTTELKRTPKFPSGSNRTLEQREFFLQDYGPVRIVETTQWFGNPEAYFRSSYSGRETKEFKEALDDYVQSAYLADAVSKYEYGDAKDFTKPFMLRLEIPKAKRGNTDMNEAVVAIRLTDMVSGAVPERIRVEEEKQDETSPPDEAGLETKVRTDDWYLSSTWQTEWQYRIVPPFGFHVRVLPETKIQSFGPALLAQEYRTASDGSVEATIRFDMVKRRYSTAEVVELGRALKQLRENGVLFIYFDLAANTLLQQGKVREAFAEYRRNVAARPKEAIHRARLSRACLSASLGESAREEAQQAIKLDPQSAVAYETLGFVLQHDLVGRRFARGFDPKGAAAAFQKAKALDPGEPNYSLSLGESLEYDEEGERYTGDVNLDEVINVYRELKNNEDADANSVNEHLLYALAYARRFTELRDLLADLGDSPLNRMMRVLASDGLDGSDAALQKAAEIASDEKKKSDALAGAGNLAMRMRIYPDAAELLAASAVNQPNASTIANLAQVLKRTRKHEDLPRNDGDPVSLVLHALIASTYHDKGAEVGKLMSRAFYELSGKSSSDLLKKNWTLRFRTELPENVMLDITLALLKTNVEGDQTSGYKVSLQPPGTKSQHIYVIRETGALKILSENENLEPLGQEVLDRIARNDLKGAKVLLDWAREDRKLAGGEDPYAGPAFARLWSKSNDADPFAMRIAAITLISSAPRAARPYISELEAALEKPPGGTDRMKIEEALMLAYLSVTNWPKLEHTATKILEQTESPAIFRILTIAQIQQCKWEDLAKLIQLHKGKLDDETVIGLVEAKAYLARNLPRKAKETLKAIIDSGKGTVEIVNEYGWAAVMEGEVGPEVIETVQQTVQQPQNQQYHILHTLGCMYAIADQAAQAQEVLIAAMKRDLSAYQPQSVIWYGFGLLAESYGETETALKLYGKVEKPKDNEPAEESCYTLAQRRRATLANRSRSPAR